MTVVDEIARIVAEQAVMDVDDIGPETRLADLGLDSLGLVEAIFAIEERFDITVPFNANDPAAPSFDLTSVATVASAVERLIAEQHP